MCDAGYFKEVPKIGHKTTEQSSAMAQILKDQELWRQYGRGELQKLARLIFASLRITHQQAKSRGAWSIEIREPLSFRIAGYGATTPSTGTYTPSKDLIGQVQNMLRRNQFNIRVHFVDDVIISIEVNG
jgi:hypothetical protein